MKKLCTLLYALVMTMGALADYHDTNVQNADGNLGFGRYFWQVNNLPSGGYEDHYYFADGSTAEHNALTSWAMEGGKPKELETFLHMPAGHMSLSLAVTTRGTVQFQFIVRTADEQQILSDKSMTLTTGTHMASVLESVVLPESAYYRVRIRVLSGAENISKITHWHFDTASSEQAYHPDYLSSPSVHTNEWKTTMPTAPAGNSYDWAYEEVMIPASSDLVGTYCMSLGVFHGYMGIQVNGNNNHDIIFSMWDNGSTDANPDLPDYLRSGSLDANGGVGISRFGGEGTGTKAFRSGQYWEAGKWVKFLTNARPEYVTVTKADGTTQTYTNTLVTAWYKTEGGIDNITHAEDGEYQYDGWHYIATHRLSGGNTYMNGWYSFLENYNWPSGNLKRTAYYRRGYLHSLASGQWSHRNVVSCSHTDGGSSAGKRNDFGTGLTEIEGESAFYMTTGGLADESFVSNQQMPYNGDFEPVSQEIMDKLLGRVQQAIRNEQTNKMASEIQNTASRLENKLITVVGNNSEATNEGSANVASAIVDGNETTYWHTKWSSGTGKGSGQFPYYIDVKLDDSLISQQIEQLKLAQNRPANNRRGKTLQILCSAASTYPGANNSAWTDYGTYSMENENYVTINLTKPITGQRYIRLNYTQGYESYISLNEVYFITAPEREQVNTQVENLLNDADQFDGYRSEDLAELRAAYASGQWKDYNIIKEALLNVARKANPIKFGVLTEINSISSFKAYQLHNVNDLGDLIANTETQTATLGNVTAVTPSQSSLAEKFDVTSPENNWLVLRSEQYNSHFIYNIGLHKFLKIGTTTTLTDEPTPVRVTKVNTGFIFRTDLSDSNGFLAATPTSSWPVGKNNSDALACVWELRDNYGLTPDVELVRTLLADVQDALEIDGLKQQAYTLLSSTAPLGVVGSLRDASAKNALSTAYNNGQPSSVSALRKALKESVVPFEQTKLYTLRSCNGWNDGYMTAEAGAPYHRTYAASNMGQLWAFPLRTDGTQLMMSQGQYMKWEGGKPVFTQNSREAKIVSLVDQGDGRWNVSVEGGRCIDANAQPLTGWSNDVNSRWYLTPIETINLTIPSSGIKGVCYPFDIDLSGEPITGIVIERLEANVAYCREMYGGTNGANVIKAGTPVILKGKTGTYKLNISCHGIPTQGESLLLGNYLQQSITTTSSYIPTTNGGEMRFAHPTSNILSANSVYIQKQTGIADANIITVEYIKDYELGDVNKDDTINVGDLTALVSLILGTGEGLYLNEAADMDGNGLINVTDYTLLVAKILQN